MYGENRSKLQAIFRTSNIFTAVINHYTLFHLLTGSHIFLLKHAQSEEKIMSWVDGYRSTTKKQLDCSVQCSGIRIRNLKAYCNLFVVHEFFINILGM